MRSRNAIRRGGAPSSPPSSRSDSRASRTSTTEFAHVPLIDNLYDVGAIGVAGRRGPPAARQRHPRAADGPPLARRARRRRHREPRLVERPRPGSSGCRTPRRRRARSRAAPRRQRRRAVPLLSALEELVQPASRRLARRRRAVAPREQDGGANAARTSAKAQTTSAAARRPAVVVARLRRRRVDRARLVQLAESAADAGIFPIWVADDVIALPAVCRTFVDLRRRAPHDVGLVRLGRDRRRRRTELIDRRDGPDFARAPRLGRRRGRARRGLERPPAFGLDAVAARPRARRSAATPWSTAGAQNDSIHDRAPGAARRRRPGSCAPLVGTAASTPMHLDLRTQGPHALVGGTTGAGKSEFLQAWVLGMAAEHSPDRVTSCSSTTRAARRSPTASTCRTASAWSPTSARTSCAGRSPRLRAELHYREQLLNRKKAKDLLELEKRGDPDTPPSL